MHCLTPKCMTGADSDRLHAKNRQTTNEVKACMCDFSRALRRLPMLRPTISHMSPASAVASQSRQPGGRQPSQVTHAKAHEPRAWHWDTVRKPEDHASLTVPYAHGAWFNNIMMHEETCHRAESAVQHLWLEERDSAREPRDATRHADALATPHTPQNGFAASSAAVGSTANRSAAGNARQQGSVRCAVSAASD